MTTFDLPRAKRQRLQGWGMFPIHECEVYRPERREELQALVANAPQRSLLARGLGRAYGDAALNQGQGVILSENFDRLLEFDESTGVLRCEAAVSLAEILDIFLPRGFFLPVTPGTKHISIGGAIAADVHGKNHHHSGTIAAFLESFQLLLANGDILECSRQTNSEAFWATVGGMGLTGIVLEAQLRLKSVENAYVTVDYEKTRDLDGALESFLLHDKDHMYSAAWIDCLSRGAALGRSVILRANHTPMDELPDWARRAPWKVGHLPAPPVPFKMPNRTLNPWTVGAFNAAFYRGHPTGARVRDCNTFFYPLDSVAHWNRAYGRRGVIQYQVVIPLATAREALIGILEEVSSAKLPVFLSVLKPFGDADEGLLSFPRPGYTISLDVPHVGDRLRVITRRLDALVLRHGGAVYLAKDSCLDPESLVEMYPGLGRFRALKAKLDPECRFSSSQARRLQIVEGD